MDRRQVVEQLKSFMTGRSELRIPGARLEHDLGQIVMRSSDGAKDWAFLEVLSDNELERFSLAAAKVTADDIKAAAEAGVLEVKDITSVTGIALGSSAHGDRPGFPGAVKIGEARKGESAEAMLERIGREKRAAQDKDKPSKYLDPAQNPLIRLPGDEHKPRPKDPTEPADPGAKYLDPAKNPFIRYNPEV